MALRTEIRGRPYRASRRGDVQELAVLYDAGRAFDLPGCQRWQGSLGHSSWRTTKLGYFATMAPLVIRDHIIAGVSGDSTDIRGILTSVDPETGAVQWHWYTEPDPGQPGSETWPKDGDALLHGGGMTWMTGTYDPALNLLYWGTGNPNPVLVGDSRPGDNLYTCSIVALNPDTGKLAWAFQPSPHDVHDWDAVQTPILFDAEFKGKQRKLLAQASRNGFFFVLDRTSGEHLLTSAFIDQTWASGVDAKGRPVAKPSANPSRGRCAGGTRLGRSYQLDGAEFRPADESVLCDGASDLRRFLQNCRGEDRRLGRTGSQPLGEHHIARAGLQDGQSRVEP